MPTLPPITRLYVRLHPDELRRLGVAARAERRPVADHAAYLITKALDVGHPGAAVEVTDGANR